MTHAVGVVSTIDAQRSCGFIKHKQGTDVAFDASDLQNLAFDQTLIDRQVRFVLREGQNGMLARAVRPA